VPRAKFQIPGIAAPFPAELIAHAVWLYMRFPLSLRMVEDLLAVRGIVVSHEADRHWSKKFGRVRLHFASECPAAAAAALFC